MQDRRQNQNICLITWSGYVYVMMTGYLSYLRKYLYLYPEMIASEIYAYKDMYEDDECWGGD